MFSAIRMSESGFASKEDIDRGMVLGCAHPMGPLALPTWSGSTPRPGCSGASLGAAPTATPQVMEPEASPSGGGQAPTVPSGDADSLQPQDLAVTLLGAYVLPRPREVWSGGMVRLMGEFGFSRAAARVALARLVRRGLLDRVKEGRLVFYVLTERSEHVLAEGDKRIFSLGWDDDWDGTWTVLWHSLPERQRVKRARLARRLRFLGFGSVHDGTWISPHNREADVLELIRDLDVEQHTGVLLGRPAGSMQIDNLIERAWDLEELAQRYDDFVGEFSRYRAERARLQLSDEEAFCVRTRVVHAFRRFPFLDPGLPDELVGRHVPRREAAATFHEVYDALAESAQRHFDGLTSSQYARSARVVRR